MGIVPRSLPIRALIELDENDSILLKEMTALAADRIRVQFSVLSQPSSVKIGEAYDGYHRKSPRTRTFIIQKEAWEVRGRSNIIQE